MKTLIVLAAALSLSLTGCVSMPKETALLSHAAGEQLGRAEESHLALVEEWGDQRRARAEEFLRRVWTPGFIKRFLANPKVDFDAKVCEAAETDRAAGMQRIVEVISKQVERLRRSVLKEIDREERALARGVRRHYRAARATNQAITANVQSVHDRLELEAAVRGAAVRGLDKLVPVSAASERLDKFLNEEAK